MANENSTSPDSCIHEVGMCVIYCCVYGNDDWIISLTAYAPCRVWCCGALYGIVGGIKYIFPLSNVWLDKVLKVCLILISPMLIVLSVVLHYSVIVQQKLSMKRTYCALGNFEWTLNRQHRFKVRLEMTDSTRNIRTTWVTKTLSFCFVPWVYKQVQSSMHYRNVHSLVFI